MARKNVAKVDITFEGYDFAKVRKINPSTVSEWAKDVLASLETSHQFIRGFTVAALTRLANGSDEDFVAMAFQDEELCSVWTPSCGVEGVCMGFSYMKLESVDAIVKSSALAEKHGFYKLAAYRNGEDSNIILHALSSLPPKGKHAHTPRARWVKDRMKEMHDHEVRSLTAIYEYKLYGDEGSFKWPITESAMKKFDKRRLELEDELTDMYRLLDIRYPELVTQS